MEDMITFDIPAGYEHVVRDAPIPLSINGIQQVLIDLWRDLSADPTYLLLRDDDLSVVQRLIAEGMNIRTFLAMDEGDFRLISLGYALNQTTGTVIKLHRDDRLEQGKMLFLYKAAPIPEESILPQPAVSPDGGPRPFHYLIESPISEQRFQAVLEKRASEVLRQIQDEMVQIFAGVDVAVHWCEVIPDEAEKTLSVNRDTRE
jgi:hypothetical protein